MSAAMTPAEVVRQFFAHVRSGRDVGRAASWHRT